MMSHDLLHTINELNFTIIENNYDTQQDDIKQRSYIIGIISKDTARQFVKKFNSNFDNYAYALISTNHKNKIYIPVALKDNIVIKSLPLYTDLHSLDKVIMVCYDTKWNYNATQNDGLYNRIISALN